MKKHRCKGSSDSGASKATVSLQKDASTPGEGTMDEAGFASVEVAERCVRQALGHHPNDLSRLIYLTSLRDYNSGTYLHPFLSHMYGVSAVHHALESYHRELFRRLIASSVEEYVHQLRAYICYTRSERRLFIR